MLVAPVITLAENYLTSELTLVPSSSAGKTNLLPVVYGSKQEKPSCNKHSEVERSSRGSTALRTGPQHTCRQLVRGDPDFDLYSVSGSFLVAVWVIVTFIVAFSLFILISKGLSDGGSIAALELIWAWGGTARYEGVPNIMLLVYFMTCMLYSLSIDQHLPDSKAGRVAVNVACFFLYCAIITGGWALGAIRIVVPRGVEIFVAVLVGLYLMLLALEMYLSQKHSTNRTSQTTRSKEAEILLNPLVAGSSTRRTSSSSARSAVVPLPAIDTSGNYTSPRRQDTEADIGLLSPRRRWTSDI